MLYELDRDQTRQHVRSWLRGRKVQYELREDQARRVEQHATRFLAASTPFFSPALQRQAEGAWHSAMLTGAIDQYGYTFEALANLTNLEVATTVAGLTPDSRLPPPRRRLAHASDLGQASDMTQLIKLVQIADALRLIKAAFILDPAAQRPYLRTWLPEVTSYTDVIWRTARHPTLRKVRLEVQWIGGALVEALDRWQHREAIIARLQQPMPSQINLPPRHRTRAKDAPAFSPYTPADETTNQGAALFCASAD